MRVGRTVYVIGGSEGGLSKLGEIAEDRLDLPEEEPMKGPFADVLARILSRPTKDEPDAPEKEEEKEEETT